MAASTSTTVHPSSQPWVEKYRPRTVEDVAHQEEVVKTLQKALHTANLPHLLFYGPPGTGKTTTALAISRQLFGPELMKTRVLELNASDERGISVVRDKIKGFAATSVGQAVAGYPCPPFKIIILDEADSMTQDAQNALRRTMEAFSHITRFVFICNYVSRIIDPLASRCAKFRFKPLSGGVINARIQHICKCENVEISPEVMSVLDRVSGGDLRKAITTLQSAVRLKGTPVAAQTLLDVSSSVPPAVTQGLYDACCERSYGKMQAYVQDMVADGYPILHVLLDLQALVLSRSDLPDDHKAAVCKTLAVADKDLVDGSDELLQILSVASKTQRILTGVPVVV